MKTNSYAHYLLPNAEDRLAIAGFALESMVSLAKKHGVPIPLNEGRAWLEEQAKASNNEDAEWLEWRLEGIFQEEILAEWEARNKIYLPGNGFTIWAKS